MSAIVGVIIGAAAIALPSVVPKPEYGKKDDDMDSDKVPKLKLNADKLLDKSSKFSQFQNVLGISDSDIRKAVDDVNKAQDDKTNTIPDLDPINWAKVLEWLIILPLFFGMLWFLNVESKGEVVQWLCSYFPLEMSTLKFECKYVRSNS